MLLKLERGNSQLPLNGEAIKRLNTFYDFDHQVTAPLHGFNGVDDYYQRASALPLLGKIAKPTLILHAADDPFMTDAVIPSLEHLPACVEYELHANGGHVALSRAAHRAATLLSGAAIAALSDGVTHADTL